MWHNNGGDGMNGDTSPEGFEASHWSHRLGGGRTAAAGTEATTVLLATEDALVRDLIAFALSRRGVTVLGAAVDAGELHHLSSTLAPDVVVSSDGVAVEPTLTELAQTGTRVIVLATDASPERLAVLLSNHVWGCFSLDALPDDIVDGVLAVARGRMALDGAVATTIVQQWRQLRTHRAAGVGTDHPHLTAREQQVLAAMAEGLAVKAIATRLGLSPKTIENHKVRVFGKLGVRSQAHAVSVAIAGGLAPRVAAPRVATKAVGVDAAGA